jgi:predicted lipoprotein with Yx(FWY)xxD motif
MERDTQLAPARSDRATTTPPGSSSTLRPSPGPGHRPGRALALVLGIAAVAVLLAACGSSSKTATSNSPGTTAASTATTVAPSTTGSTTVAQALAGVGAASATGKTLSLAKDSHGIFLIGPDGHTLYVYAKDTGTTSACTGACASAWPPLMATATPTTGPGVDPTKVTVVSGQVAYGGHLLYYFANDTAPGQTNGVGIPNWNLLGPLANVMGNA